MTELEKADIEWHIEHKEANIKLLKEEFEIFGCTPEDRNHINRLLYEVQELKKKLQ